MFYADGKDFRKTKKLKRRRRRGGCLTRLVLFALLCILIAIGIGYVFPITQTQSEKERYSANNTVDIDAVNILLLGCDQDGNNTSRSDSILVASIGKNGIMLTSLMRDMEVEIPGKGTAKLNAAYAWGGPELTIKTINTNFGLNITKYAAVDFNSFSDIVDALGGVNITVSDTEAQEINKNVLYQLRKKYDAGLITYDEAKRIYYDNELLSGGSNLHLSGQQALGFSRIRKTDSDYMRASRQRTVLTAIIKKTTGLIIHPVAAVKTLKAVLSSVNTNLSYPEMFALGIKGISSGTLKELRLPYDGTFKEGKRKNNEWRQYSIDFAQNKTIFVDTYNSLK